MHISKLDCVIICFCYIGSGDIHTSAKTPPNEVFVLNKLTVSEHGWCCRCNWHQQCILGVAIEWKTGTSGGQERIFYFTWRTVHDIDVKAFAICVCNDTDITWLVHTQ